MNNKIQIHEFDPVIYPYKVWVIVNKSPNILSETFNKYNGEPIDTWDDTENCNAFAMAVRKKDNLRFGCILYFTSKKIMTYNVVAHESSHAAKMLFEHIDCDIKEHEPFEYVVGWIAECCEKVLKNKF